eukprot:7383767-Prymnesium_polylepis.1
MRAPAPRPRRPRRWRAELWQGQPAQRLDAPNQVSATRALRPRSPAPTQARGSCRASGQRGPLAGGATAAGDSARAAKVDASAPWPSARAMLRRRHTASAR